MTTPHASRFVTALFLVVMGAATLLMGQLLAVYLAAIVLALVLRTLFAPLHARLLARLGRRELAAAGSTMVVVALVLVPVTGFGFALSAQAVRVYNQISGREGVIDKLRHQLDTDAPMMVWLHDQAAKVSIDLSRERMIEMLNELAAAIGGFVADRVGGWASDTFGMVMNFAMMVIVLYALFVDGDRLRAYMLDLSPLPDEQEMMLVDRFRAISRAVFVGNGIGSVAQGVLGGISFYVFGLGNGVLWGAAIAFFAFLPLLGASIVIVPAAGYLFLTGRVGAAIGFVIFNALYIGVLEYGVKTKLIGGQSKMNGVLIFLGIVAGLAVFGLLGLFYGPLILTMFLTLADIYKAHYRDDLMSVISPWVRRDDDRSVEIAIPSPDSPTQEQAEP